MTDTSLTPNRFTWLLVTFAAIVAMIPARWVGENTFMNRGQRGRAQSGATHRLRSGPKVGDSAEGARRLRAGESRLDVAARNSIGKKWETT